MYDQIKLSGGFKHKFPMPQSKNERAQAVILIGIALIIGGAWDPIINGYKQVFYEVADAKFVKADQYKQSGPKRLVGVYVFKDNAMNIHAVHSKIIYTDANLIPKAAKVTYKRGEALKAKLVENKTENLWAVFLGLLLCAFGGYLFKNKPKAFVFEPQEHGNDIQGDSN